MAAEETSKDPHEELSALWSVHSETEGQPMMRAWTKSEAEAEAELEKLKASDEDASKTEYWVMQLTTGDVNNFKASGFIPEDA
jgi:hypothetical protein